MSRAIKSANQQTLKLDPPGELSSPLTNRLEHSNFALHDCVEWSQRRLRRISRAGTGLEKSCRQTSDERYLSQDLAWKFAYRLHLARRPVVFMYK